MRVVRVMPPISGVNSLIAGVRGREGAPRGAQLDPC